MFVSIQRSVLKVLGCCAGVLIPTAFGYARSVADGGRDPSSPATKSTAKDETPDGLAAEDWAGIRAAYQENCHAACMVERGGYEARNPGQQWKTSFDGRGFSVLPDAGDWTWGLQLERYGFAGNEREVSSPARTSAQGGRVSYEWTATLEEWYVNDARGLEHGLTVTERPAPGEPGDANPLAFSFKVRGLLRPEVDEDTRGVRFLDKGGATVLTYRGLLVVDAEGRELEASFKSVGDRLVLSIEEHDARYPLTIDPIVQQQAYLKASDTTQGNGLGRSVSISGDTVVVGAVGEDSDATGVNGNHDNNFAPNSGAAYVFVRSGTVWSQQATLKASNTGAEDWFGWSVSVSSDTVVVGAFREDSSATGVNGDQTNDGSGESGAAYVFVRKGTSWSQQAYLKASNTDAGDEFGHSVWLSGDTIAVGARKEDSNATGVNGDQGNNSASLSGAAYVFVRSGTSWSQQAYLKAFNTDANDRFGVSVSVAGDVVVVGAIGEASVATGMNGDPSNNSSPNSGAAYVFVRTGTNWSQQAYLKARNSWRGDRFGMSVVVSGETVVVGAPHEDSAATGINGDGSDEGSLQAGAAYVFVRSGTTWSQEAYLKASNTRAFDWFGSSVALSGDVVVVGAEGEDSSARRVNGDQHNTGAPSGGAAYMFVRNGTTWTQVAYLKASNTDAFDAFGVSVSVSYNTVVVGANVESSSATGVNGDQTDNSAFNAGAAYVFEILPPVTYCAGKTTSAGCVPFVSVTGTSSTSSGPFFVRSNDHLEGQAGMLIYSTTKGNLDFHGGKLCVKNPLQRVVALVDSTDGIPCTTCTGNCRMFKRNFNQIIRSGQDPMLTVGQNINVQWRQRDPGDPLGFGDNLSDGLSFVVGL